MNKKLLSFAAFGLTVLSLSAQTRYCGEVFTGVTKTDSVVYSTNRIYWPFTTGIPPIGDLTMDVYEPTGDQQAARPLAIVLHTGNFLPQPYNQAITGSRKDSNVVETCKRFARRGFVAAAITYRGGWNAISSDQDVRTSTLLKAVYRGLQDTKNAVRYFRKDAATTNQFKIDPTKVVILGYGTGGYLALAYATLDKFEEITLGKFLDGTTALPYVDTNIMGNFDGLGGDPNYNLPNWPEYSSDVSMVINAGGAIGDSTWLEAGDVPICSFHCPSDPYAPYTQGMVIVPTTGGNVVYVSGSYEVIRRANNPMYGNNNGIFRTPQFIDGFTQAANVNNDGFEGLFPFKTANTQESSPWDWWDIPNAVGLWGQTNVTNALATTPDMSRTKAVAYLDTIFGYAMPRIVRVFGLENCPGTVGINERNAGDVTSIYPNPATDIVSTKASSKDALISEINIFDGVGRLAKQIVGINKVDYGIDISSLSKGLYIMKITTNKGVSEQKLQIQ